MDAAIGLTFLNKYIVNSVSKFTGKKEKFDTATPTTTTTASPPPTTESTSTTTPSSTPATVPATPATPATPKTPNKTALMAGTIISIIIGFCIGIFAAHLSWSCNTAEGYSTGVKIIYAVFAFIFGLIYLLFYLIFRAGKCNTQKPPPVMQQQNSQLGGRRKNHRRRS